MTLKVGVVGMGLMGTLHAQIYASMPEAELIGLVEMDVARKSDLEQQFRVPVYQGIDEILDKVDALSICTPDHLHKEPILQAFEKGVKVLVEKPLTVSVREAQKILAQRPDPSYLMVGHVLRFDPRVIHCKEIIENGELGPLWRVHIWRHNSLNVGYKIGPRTSVSWFLGIHDIELLLWLTGLKIETVSSIGSKVISPHWDIVQAQFEMEDGVVASIENSWILPTQRSSGLDAGIKIVGEKGMVDINLSHTDVAVSTINRGRQMNLDTYHWPMAGNSPHGDLRRELQSFVNSVIQNEIPPVTGEQGLEAVQMIEYIERSLETGQKIRV